VTRLKVIKRDCSEVDFDKNKIRNAITKAMKHGSGAVKISIADDIANEIEEEFSSRDEIGISDIENMVFDKLISKKQKLTAKAYEGYRQIREFQRDVTNSTDESIIELLTGTSEYWNSENSNKNAKLVTTQRDYMAGIVSEDISKRFLLAPEIVQANQEGIIHFHDIDYFGQDALHNCDLINLEDMLQNGTTINGVMIEKPHRFITAMTIATQIITAVTSSQYGGASISLTHLAPFVKDSYNKIKNEVEEEFSGIYGINKTNDWSSDRDERIEQITNKRLLKEIKDGVQTFNYQINSMTTTNGQSPFLTVFMYLNETEEYKNELALIIEEFIRQRITGMKNKVGVYVTQAFPKLIYVLEDDNINEDSKYYYLTKLSAECSAKRLVPDYISEKVMKELKEGNCYPVMGCRSALSPWKDENDNYKFYGRFNQGVVTLNLVDLALSSEGSFEKFWDMFEERTELCHKALLIRHNRLKGTLSDVAPILWQHGALARLKSGETIDKLLYGGYSTISLGYAGLYECVKYMTGNSHTDNGIGKEFGLKIMKSMNDKCNQWKEEDNLGYSPYGSPIESTTYKFAKCLKNRFGVVEGITDRDYITNSYHVPVFEEIDAFEKLNLESKFQNLSLGGAISYIETSDLTNNIDAILEVLKYLYYNVMYAELNTKSDYCQKCGYTGEILIDDNMNWYCPICENRNQDMLNVARRTCGYIGSNFWNKGRTEEIKKRYVHIDNYDYKEGDCN
jgi:ribonucleoside-triphosphate reductase